MNLASLLFGFQGRINRAKYWLAVLIYVIIGLVLAVLGYVADQATAFQLLSIIVNIALFISGLAVGAKRLHDRDKSAWWLLLFYIVPLVLFVVGAMTFFFGLGSESAGGIVVGSVAYVIGFVVLVWAFIEIACLRGTIGPNRFGPDPLAVELTSQATVR